MFKNKFLNGVALGLIFVLTISATTPVVYRIARGGTGLSAQTIGAILYGPLSGTSMGQLAPGAKGSALLFEGTGAAPVAGGVLSPLYSALSASAAHTGASAAETTVMPATDEGTAETDFKAWLTAGAYLPWNVSVLATGNAGGTETLTVNVYFGTVLVGTSGAVDIDGATVISMDGGVRIRGVGTPADATGYYRYRSFAGAVPTQSSAAIPDIDISVTTPFVVKLDWGGANLDAPDTATVEDASLFRGDI